MDQSWWCRVCGAVGQKSWGFNVAPQNPIPLHQICQQQCFWAPRKGTFEMHNAKTCALLAWRPKRAHLCTNSASNSAVGYLGRACLKCAMPKHCPFGVPPQARIPLHQICQQQCSWVPRMGMFEMHNAKKMLFWRGAPSTHTSAPNMPATVFLDT